MYKFSCRTTNTAFRSELLTCRTLWHSRTKFSRVCFFFFLKYFQYFFWTSIFYLKVFVRKWWHSIPIKILDHSDLLGNSHTKFSRVLFFFYWNFNFFKGPLNFIDKFLCKNANIAVQSKFLTVQTLGYSHT